MKSRFELFESGKKLMLEFCRANNIAPPELRIIKPREPFYQLATCAYYRPTKISIMIEKCAKPGLGGRAWSWPSYCIDRTPYGVIQHELGHHVDHLLSPKSHLLSETIWIHSQEKPLTGYPGTDQRKETFYKEWFAEMFRLFVTNPDLLCRLRPKAFASIYNKFKSVTRIGWLSVLAEDHKAPFRITNQARRKIEQLSL